MILILFFIWLGYGFVRDGCGDEAAVTKPGFTMAVMEGLGFIFSGGGVSCRFSGRRRGPREKIEGTAKGYSPGPMAPKNAPRPAGASSSKSLFWGRAAFPVGRRGRSFCIESGECLELKKSLKATVPFMYPLSVTNHEEKRHPMVSHGVPFELEMVAGIGLEPMTKGL